MISGMKDMAATDNLLYNGIAEPGKNNGTACRGRTGSIRTEGI